MPHMAEVLLDVAHRRLDQTFHYKIPEKMEIRLGMRVLVPLQQRKVQGLVVGLTDVLPEGVEGEKVRSILSVLESEVVPVEMIELAVWLAQTTLCSTAQSLHAVWPLLKGKVEEWIIPVASLQDGDIQALEWLDPEVYRGIKALYRARRHGLPGKELQERAGLSPVALERMLQAGWVKQESRFSSNWKKVKDLSSTEFSPPLEQISTAKNTRVLQGEAAAVRLTPEQRQAASQICRALDQKSSQTLLLHGITGSGKTQVYREAINHTLSRGGDAVLLVPEISLAAQVADFFQAHFPGQVAILHSGLTAGEKSMAWEEMRIGAKRLVIGARSAVFAPLPNLRLIILDEEHDSAYKQDENPKYHAREVARKRMEQRQGVVVLGSATPALESYAAAQTGKVELISMPSRVEGRSLPPVTVVDMRQEILNGNRSIFSLVLREKLEDRVRRKEQSMIFLNRRGYSTFVVCRECGYVVQCPHCDIALTYHTQGQMMRCHYCNHEQVAPHRCPQCGSRYIRFFGQGTQRVEEELSALLPGVSVLRLDGDTTRSEKSHREILSRFRRQEGAVLVGTQMMAKGLDFPNVTLVGVMAADQTLNMPDFRSRERTFQLLTQVAGRAGRSEKPGEVLIQTYSPGDRAITRAVHHDYPGFFWDEIAYRKERLYPPFTQVIRVLLLHEKEEQVIRGAHEMGAIVRQTLLEEPGAADEMEILGPAPAVMPKLKNLFRWQLSIKGKKIDRLRAVLHTGTHRFFQRPESSGIMLNVEVNPLSN